MALLFPLFPFNKKISHSQKKKIKTNATVLQSIKFLFLYERQTLACFELI